MMKKKDKVEEAPIDLWARALIEEREDPKFLDMREYGLKVFEVLEFGEKFTPPGMHPNKLNISKKKAGNYAFTKKSITTPSHRYLVVRVKFWGGIEEHEGRKATILVTERAWHEILNTSARLKRLGIKQPPNILYWPKVQYIHWFCFLSDKRLQEMMPFLRIFRKGNNEHKLKLEEDCYWDGYRRIHFTKKDPKMLEKFINFYKGQE